MKNLNMTAKTSQFGKVSQALLIVLVIGLTVAAISAFLLFSKPDTASEDSHGHGAEEAHAEEGHADENHDEEGHSEGENSEDSHSGESATEEGHSEGAIELTTQQLQQQGVTIARTSVGVVNETTTVPAMLVTNTDQQAHVSSMFSGRVESVNANLGQRVGKGQRLATIVSPDLVGQQSNVQLAQSNLQLAQQEYNREKQLWSQGVSAKQDYQRAENAYRKAQIELKVAQSQIQALGGAKSSNGRYTLTAPMSGVISNKDIMVGEYVQLADQLFVIDELSQLWLEFVLPSQQNIQLAPNQQIEFTALQNGQTYQARIQTLASQADQATGRLQVRAVVLSKDMALRPNLKVSVNLPTSSSKQVLRVQKQAVQQIDGKNVVFVATQHGDNVEFYPQEIDLGSLSTAQQSSDQQWVEVRKGLTANQSYASQGSFLLKSELEKGEAAHAH
ncbi:efflux RND transporter periplasmic adaptor subunit [Acinetobacter sp. A3.8]|uniref:Efflux RND transporter periplasmic adaptor subunit n=1 Tax=Acinetobacter sedimenti TaxID=2919922 RepID=A0A9X1X0H5_9GAMM|nr:efflux RND transporter periplasmic adaptor subunit [Acinetobacter sedimenti]MCJ8145631.1 efflux RND transporter periplasmic adaptor subunit [Acinetobacter sedimenti]